MKNHYQNLIVLLKRLLLVLLIYQLSRLLFLALNYSYFDALTSYLIIGGLRFDLSSIIYTNLIIIVGHSIVGNFKNRPLYQSSLKIVFFIVNSLFILTNFIDIEYFKFTGRRSSFKLITADGMEEDIPRLLSAFAIDYWHIILLAIITLYGFWKLIPDFIPNKIKPLTVKNYVSQFGLFATLIGLSILIGRGGFQRAPLKRVDAVKYTKAQNATLVLNTPFCILKTFYKKQDIKPKSYFKDHELSSLYTPVKSYKTDAPFKEKNIVIIILESFGDEFLAIENSGKGYTPFLDSLITKSLYFKNAFANGKRSIDAVPSVITSIPGLMDNSFISSTYSFNNTRGLPKILKEKGYHTSFFHGAFNGSQNFNEFAKISEFDHYYGKNEFPLKNLEDDDNRWGIFDEPFFQFFNKKLSSFEQPFFSTFFSISSHTPFIIPEKHKNTFPKGTSEFHESIGYTDYALKRFFNVAKKEKWYKNTLFVITSDHTSSSKSKSDYYKNSIGNFSIPILFFDPSNQNLNGINYKNIQQIDIMPSILHYLNYDSTYVSFGQPFQDHKESLIANYLNDSYHFIIDSLYYNFDGNNFNEVYNWKKDSLLSKKITTNIPINDKNKIKAYIQTFNHRVISNTLDVK
ncbi:MAG: LTA synthase family protein [Flavobacteriales bacterium]